MTNDILIWELRVVCCDREIFLFQNFVMDNKKKKFQFVVFHTAFVTTIVPTKWKNKEKIIANVILPPFSSRTIHQLIVFNIQSTADSRWCVCVWMREWARGRVPFSLSFCRFVFEFFVSNFRTHLTFASSFLLLCWHDKRQLTTNKLQHVRSPVANAIHVLELNENFSMTLSTSSVRKIHIGRGSFVATSKIYVQLVPQ